MSRPPPIKSVTKENHNTLELFFYTTIDYRRKGWKFFVCVLPNHSSQKKKHLGQH